MLSQAACGDGHCKTRMMRNILLFGDSHSYAVQRALERRVKKGRPCPLTAHRLRKIKNQREVGDTSFEEFLDLVGLLTPEDVVLSAIGGNQHAVFSTIQHPEPFDFIDPETGTIPQPGVELIPYRTIEGVFDQGIRNGDGKSIETLRKATNAQVVHIIPPPPKADNAFIQQNHESIFAREGIEARGVSSPSLRLKFWLMQTRVLKNLCDEINVDILLPPEQALDDEGFLAREYYVNDATHANADYGELLLREIESRYGLVHLEARAR